MDVYNAPSFLTKTQILHTQKSKAAQIINLLLGINHTARIVGGAVRDMLLGMQVQDFDITTDATPDKVLKALQENNINALTFGMQFGTIVAILDGQKIEITTLRQDVKCFGRKAHVEFTTDYEIDAKRRDFTINSLSYCIVTQKIFDYCSGMKDIFAKKVQFIGIPELRIKEDYLRIMRFFRFSNIHANTFNKTALTACLHNQRDMISNVDSSRIIKELGIILNHSSFSAISIMHKIKTLNLLFDGLKITSMQTIKRLIIFLQTNIIKSYNIFDFRKSMLYAVMLFDNESGALTSKLKEKKFPTKEINNIISFINFAKTINIKSNKNYRQEFQSIFAQLWYKKNCFNETACNIIFSSIIHKIEYPDVLECLAFFDKKKKLVMPISNSEIAQKVRNKKDISMILQKLEDMWLSTNFQATPKQLLIYLDSLLQNK
jgi:poly(A) polymerase